MPQSAVQFRTKVTSSGESSSDWLNKSSTGCKDKQHINKKVEHMLETRLQQCQEHLVWQKQYNEKVSVDNIETTAQLPQSLDELPLYPNRKLLQYPRLHGSLGFIGSLVQCWAWIMCKITGNTHWRAWCMCPLHLWSLRSRRSLHERSEKAGWTRKQKQNRLASAVFLQ